MITMICIKAADHIILFEKIVFLQACPPPGGRQPNINVLSDVSQHNDMLLLFFQMQFFP
jgi:hypothetical protein